MKTDPELSELSTISPNKIGLLDPPDTEFESQVHLLYIMLNTLEGEMVYNNGFGVNWTSILPKGMSNDALRNFEYEAIGILNEKAKQFLPNFSVKKVESQNTYDEYRDATNLIVLSQWVYRQKFTIDALTVVKWNDKFGTLLSDVKTWNSETNSPSNTISAQMITNMINIINSYLKEL